MYEYLRPDVGTATLDDIPDLVRLAWDAALVFPEFGDDIIDDLMADVRGVVARGKGMLEQDRAQAQAEQARWQSAKETLRRSLEKVREKAIDATAEIAEEGRKGGMNPHGWFVYILWPSRDSREPLYVGRSGNLLSRVGAHVRDPDRTDRIGWVSFIRCRTEKAMVDRELDLIVRYRPPWNTAGITWPEPGVPAGGLGASGE